MSKDYDIRSSQELYKAVLALRNSEEADIFFRDILTAKELNEIAERWLIAKKLDEGLPYRDVAKELDVSTTTVTRTARWLYKGTGGFRLALNRLKARSS